MGVSGREEDGDGAKDHHHHQVQDDEHIAPSGGRWIPNVLKGVRDNVSANLSEPKIGISNATARRSFGFGIPLAADKLREGAIAASNMPRKVLAAIREP
jgi:hypothetical protein